MSRMRMNLLAAWLCIPLFAPQDDPAKQLLGKLHSKFNSDREEAMHALIERGAPVLPALEALTEDPDPDVRERAARAIEEIQFNGKVTPNLRRRRPGIELRLRKARDPVWTREFLDVSRREGGLPFDRRLKRGDVEPLTVQALRGASTPAEEIELCNRVADWGFRSGSPEIQCLFENAEADVRRAAIRAAGRIGDPAAVPGLVERLADENEWVAQTAAQSLAGLRAREAAPDVLALLQHPSPRTRCAALQALRWIGLTDFLPKIRERLGDEDQRVRAGAIWALLEMRSMDSASSLVPLLRDPDPHIRGTAAEALGRLEAKESVPGLLALLSDSQGDVAGHAAGALARLSAREAIPALRKMLPERSGSSWSRDSVLQALAALGACEIVPELRELLRNPGAESGAALALSALDAREAIPDLLARLKENASPNLEMIFTALHRMRPAEGIADLRALLKHRSSRIQGYAARLLAEVRAAEAVPDLLELLQDRDPEVRCWGAVALGAAGGAAQVPRLSKLLKDADPQVRRCVLGALDRLDAQPEMPEILACLQDPHRKVRVAAAEWLCHRGRREGAAIVFEQAPVFHALNALRNPEAWDRLKRLQRPVQMEGSPKQIVSQLAALAGMHFEGPAANSDPEEWPRPEPYRFKNPDGHKNVLETLEEVLDGCFVPYGFILNDRTLRLVSSDAAMEFWEAWLDRQPKK
jgi:HEAT repeat protein